jgi:hypothetical protein
MKKKIWIRLVGLLALVGWAAGAMYFRASMLAPDIATKANVSILMFMTFFAAGVITAVWALFSIIDWALRRQAKLRAGQLAQGLPGDAPGRWSATAAPHPAAPQASVWPTCAFCRAYPAAWLCSRHQWPACLACANAHLQTEPQCTYAPLAPAAAAPREAPRAVVTSPLAGMR